MSRCAALALFILGIVHIVFGVVKFYGPLSDAVMAGFVGQFREPEIRRTAFWFLMCGPLLMLLGHIARRAARSGDLALLKLIGVYGLLASIVGIAAFPLSPLWALFVISLLLIAAGYGRLP